MTENATEVPSEVVSNDSTPVEGESSEAIVESSEAPEAVEGSTESVASEESPLVLIEVDGESIEIPLEEARLGYQKAYASAKRFQEAAELKKQALAEKEATDALFQGDVMTNVIQEAIKRGVANPEDIQNWVLNSAYELLQTQEAEANMTEAEKESRRLREENEALKKAQEEAEKQTKQQAYQAEVQKQTEAYSAQIVEAIEAGGMDKDPATIRAVARAMQGSIDPSTGRPTIDISDAVAFVKEQNSSQLNEYVRGLGVDKLMALLGDEAINSIRKADVAKLKNPLASPKVDSAPASGSDTPLDMSPQSVFDRIKAERGL